MRLEQIDRHCDEFERELKAGRNVTAEEFLRQRALPSDEQLLEELQKLRRDYDGGRVNGHPVPDSGATAPMRPGVGEMVIGRYKLLQKIGEGGMGVVYMGEQSQPVSRRVAVKIIKPGMDSREVLARFEAERQALALMDHPNIARILDAGTTEEGRPFFVMELVKGVPITTYCDERQLSPRERLELFLPICNAVQHAHQKGVIHRDIKPSNVLVAQYDGLPVPKIIDFGLAKAFGPKLTERTLFTQFGQIVGTIDYMSPEQASFNQLDVDTRGDIYSLGVLLYELLVGEPPFDKKRLHAAGIDEMLRIIRQEDPPRPSIRLSSHASLPTLAANRKTDAKKLSVLVRGELDWIVMKAIEKERDRRYQSANALADDVNRFLTNEAVAACPPSAMYRFQKFARRNRALLASGSAVLAALIVGLVGTGWAWVQTKNAEAEAMAESREKQGVLRGLHRAYSAVAFERDQFRSKEEAARALAERLADRLGPVRQDGADPTALRDDMSREAIAFWDRLIAADADKFGNPGPHADGYAVRRALSLARFGEHEQAFVQTQQLGRRAGESSERLLGLARTCAVCAKTVENNRELSELYRHSAIDFLKRAADLADQPPPAPDDADLVFLTAEPELPEILARWERGYAGTLARRGGAARRTITRLGPASVTSRSTR